MAENAAGKKVTRYRRSLVPTALALASFVAVADDATLGARYIDDNTDRIPEHTVVPDYPRIARRDRIEGEVRVCYFIDKKGRPYNIAVRDSTHRIFERPALRAVKASRYKALEPGVKNSGLKSCRTFTFSLEPVVSE